MVQNVGNNAVFSLDKAKIQIFFLYLHRSQSTNNN